MSSTCDIFPAFEEYLQPARFKVAYGGRGSGKTRTITTILLNNVMCSGWRLVCMREFMKSLDDSVYQEFVDEIDRRELNKFFKIINNEISCPYSGGVIKFDGLHRNQQKIKGYAGFDAVWVEEAAAVTETSWKFLIPTLRKPGSEIWVSYNPESPLDDTHKRFVTERMYPDYKNGRRYCIVKKINYTENPRFPQELRDDAELMKEQDPDLFDHVYGGEPVANSDLSIIPPKWIAATIDLHKKLNIEPSGGKITGFDVADEGKDFNAECNIHGWVVQRMREWKDTDPNSAANSVWDSSVEFGSEEIVFDSIGVGAGAKGELRQRVASMEYSSRIPPTITAFAASAKVVQPESPFDEGHNVTTISGLKQTPLRTNGDMFCNLKAQAYWSFRVRCYNAWKAINGKDYDVDMLISFDSDTIPEKALNKMKAEASQPRREYLSGKLRVEPKDKMAKRGVASPNLVECVIMAMSPREGLPSSMSLMFSSRR